MYVELHTASAFSFLGAASLPEALVERAAALGYPAIALLDRDGVYGAPRFHRAATAAGLRPIIGAELTMGEAGANAEGIRGSGLGIRSPNPESQPPIPPASGPCPSSSSRRKATGTSAASSPG